MKRLGFRIEYRSYISDYRKRKNLSQRNVAVLMNMNIEQYYRFECGLKGHNMEVRFFFKLAKVLEVDFLELAIKEAEYRNRLDAINNVESKYYYES